MFINTEKCKRCGACAAECPYDLIVPDAEGFPKLRPAAQKTCIACGHCVAVCPVAALSLPDMPLVTPALAPDQCRPLARDRKITPEQADQFLRSRRSIRTYRDKTIPEATLLELLDVATFAPSAKNGQPAHWIVTRSADVTQELVSHVVHYMSINNVFPGVIKNWKKGIDKICHNAPHVAVAYAAEDGFNPAEDCALAAAYLELAAHARGIGACWAGFLMEAAEGCHALRERLGIPEGHGVYASLILGYPQFRFARIPRRRSPDVHWLD